MMIGDVLHDLRSALDHTAWALVKAGSTPNPQTPRLVSFPIYDDPGNFTGHLSSKLPGVPDEQVAIIESVQPYQDGPVPQALAALARLSNEDKHRHIHASVVGTAAFNFNWEAVDCDVERTEILFEPRDVPDLVVGTPLVRIHVTNLRSDEPSVNIRGDIEPYVGIEERLALTHRLGGIRDAVLHVMTRLDPDVAGLIGQESPPATPQAPA